MCCFVVHVLLKGGSGAGCRWRCRGAAGVVLLVLVVVAVGMVVALVVVTSLCLIIGLLNH